jgi:hypothetical protein
VMMIAMMIVAIGSDDDDDDDDDDNNNNLWIDDCDVDGHDESDDDSHTCYHHTHYHHPYYHHQSLLYDQVSDWSSPPHELKLSSMLSLYLLVWNKVSDSSVTEELSQSMCCYAVL